MSKLQQVKLGSFDEFLKYRFDKLKFMNAASAIEFSFCPSEVNKINLPHNFFIQFVFSRELSLKSSPLSPGGLSVTTYNLEKSRMLHLKAFEELFAKEWEQNMSVVIQNFLRSHLDASMASGESFFARDEFGVVGGILFHNCRNLSRISWVWIARRVRGPRRLEVFDFLFDVSREKLLKKQSAGIAAFNFRSISAFQKRGFRCSKAIIMQNF